MMNSKAITINPCDGFDLLAVGDFDGRKWYLLQLTHPRSAIALTQENPETRLVFPTSIDPNCGSSTVLVKPIRSSQALRNKGQN